MDEASRRHPLLRGEETITKKQAPDAWATTTRVSERVEAGVGNDVKIAPARASEARTPRPRSGQVPGRSQRGRDANELMARNQLHADLECRARDVLRSSIQEGPCAGARDAARRNASSTFGRRDIQRAPRSDRRYSTRKSARFNQKIVEAAGVEGEELFTLRQPEPELSEPYAVGDAADCPSVADRVTAHWCTFRSWALKS